MPDRPVPHLRLVHNGPRSEHFQDGVTTGRPRISPNHPAWGKTPWEDRFPDGGQEDYPQPQTQTSGSGGSKKPPLKLVTSLGDDGEEKPQKNLFGEEVAPKPKKKKSASKKVAKPKNPSDEWSETPLFKEEPKP